MSKKSHYFLTLWPWPLTYDLEKLIRSGHYHYQCVYQIWEQSIPWFLSYRVNTIAGGGRLRRKTITSPDPSDTGDIITATSPRAKESISPYRWLSSRKTLTPLLMHWSYVFLALSHWYDVVNSSVLGRCGHQFKHHNISYLAGFPNLMMSPFLMRLPIEDQAV